MTTTSNSYAEKVFAEHPIALWSLDDQVDYVSLVTEDDRNMENSWVFKNASDVVVTPSTVVEAYPTTDSWLSNFPEPLFESVANKLIVPPTGDELKCVSPVLIQQSDIDITVKTFSIATNVYTFNRKITVKIGYEYTNALSQVVRETRNIYLLNVEEWQFISETFELPQVFTDLKMVFEIVYQSAPSGYYALIHGISMGQWTEQFNVESLGVNTSQIPTSIAISGTGTPASIYGLQDVSGYYLTKDNMFCAKNSGLPMVYGADNSTVITPNIEGEPSLILPGYGFMNDNGQYSELTLEMWLKIQSSATTPHRIFGPIASTDGLYVNDAFLVLKIGKYNASYYVGEWDRPMLVAIRISSSVASLVINGEEVIILDIDPTQINFPSKFSEDGKDQDWLGFYAYTDVPMVELDCVGIFPYEVPGIVEKRRWVYGQGVEASESISGSNLGTTVSVDYTFANYAKNYLYPDIGRWKQGIAENIVVDNTSLSIPQYELPNVILSNKTETEWYDDNSDLSSLFGEYVSLRPNSSWSSTESYMLFDNLNLLQQDLKAFYGLFESDSTNTGKQVLFILDNETTGESLEITIHGAVTEYTMKYKTTESGVVVLKSDVIYTDSLHVPGDFIFAGLDIGKFSKYNGGRVANFLGSKQQLKLYVGGSKSLSNTFSGNIYRVGFCTARNLEKISNIFSSTGIPAGFNAYDAQYIYDGGDNYFQNDPLGNHWSLYLDGGDEYFGNANTTFDEVIDGGGVYSLLVSSILAHVASYTLVPKTYMGNFILDVAVNSYWQDYVPLSYFSKYVSGTTKDTDGNAIRYQDLDFIQFNVDYPQINKFLANSFDTTNSLVRTFISFQELNDDAAISVKRFPKTVLAPKDGVVVPSDDWQTKYDGYVDYTKYEVVNDTIIYPPSNTGFNNLSLVLHIEIISNGIAENPVRIKSLQLASQALDAVNPNPIGTKFGTKVYPYRKTSEFFDYKGRNPFSIYKGSSPYFYLTSNSGLKLRGAPEANLERGISVPINSGAASFYKAAAWQMALRYDGDSFPQTVTEIFEIYSKTNTAEFSSGKISNIKFYFSPDDSFNQRGRIYAIDAATGIQQSNISFYINGKKVLNPVINTKTWTVLGFSFDEPVDFSGYEGAFRVTGPILFNNISHYQSTEADEASRSVYRKWSSLKIVENLDKDWAYWKNLDQDPETAGTQTYTWRNVLLISSAGFSPLSGTSIYKKYTGTDRVVIDTDSQFRIGGYRYLFYKDITWQSVIVTPA